jgi:spermidine/putrescine transport system permease protein
MSSGAVVSPAQPRGAEAARRRLSLTQYAGFLPALVLYGAFFAVPLGLIVAYSFWKVIDYNVVHDWTFGNYRYFFSVSTYVTTTWATAWVAALSTALTIAIAFPFAYWLARYVPKRLQRVLLVLVILPFWTSYLLLVLVYLYFPFAALTLYASLERFDWDQFKAAMDLGATPAKAMRKILLPQIKPGITTAVIFVFIPILGEYLAPQLVGGAKGVMIGNLIANFFVGGQYTRGAAAALLIAALIVVLLVIFRRSLEVEDAYGA